MFKKAKRSNLRRRNESDEDEKEESQQVQPPLQQPCGPFGVDGPMPDAPSTDLFSGVSIDVHHGNGFQSKAIKKEKRTREVGGAPKASLLSFDDDEDETEVFRVKKSNHSKKIVKQLKKEYKEDLEKVYVKQEPNTDVSLPLASIKEEPASGAGSEQGEEEMEVDSTEEQEEESKMLSHASKNPTTTASGAFSNTSTLSTLSNLRPGEIPDAAFIHAARKRRQMARELGGDAPLVETDAPKKRLVREEEQEGDGSDDEDEDEKRISFSGVKNKSQRSRIAEEIGIEGSDDEALDTAGHDEEVSRWEQEQIRKGISIPQVQSSQAEDNSSSSGVYYSSTYDAQPSYNTYSLPYSYSTAEDRAKTKVEGCPLAYSGPSGDLSPVTTELVKKRLRDRLSQMCVGHAANAKRYDQIQEELDAAQNTINRLEGSSNDNAEQYKFLQEMRGYVRDLLECFSEKVPCVSELEGAMHQLLKQRASRLVQRRRDDIKDESAEFASLSNKAVMAPNLMSPDSFGRDRTIHQEHVRQRRIAEREARRTRRRQAREQNGKRAEHREGLSSDDEETSTDLTSYCLERDRIVRECKKVFEDVLEDFHSLDCIKGRFEVWRRLYFPCYRDAFIGLCLPKLFNPLVRLQLITWNPLQEKCANFEYMGWFESLLFYGCEEQSGMNRGDVDINLLPSIVERVLLPKLAVLADQVWDPLSSSQTARLVSFLSRLIKGYPTVLNGDNRNTQEFLKTIVLRTRRTLDDDVFLPLYPKNVLCNKNSGPYLFFQRQFWSCVKLLGNILQWNGVLSYSTLRELALDSTLNRYILSALQSSEPGPDSVLKCQRVVECLPASWFVGLKGQQTLPQLEPFCRYLSHMASSLLRGSLGGSDVEKRNAKDHMKEVVKLLARLNALDHVITVATEHGIKDITPLLDPH
ncbi:PAX3- and PAX7-binding protein 1 [Esox lucius]|uniref:GCF C-terminal domain-containing protein n=1 Tax=Esox lucius TaxID=8010 RepID=A0AAY5KUK9_ESOLU|nr:PAX3- and PAX7-binding protein 1 [Esox lucius]